MRISTRGCYAVSALIEMSLDTSGDRIAVATLAQRLGISKIYLEQVFSILKRAGLITSTKGAQGGYTLQKKPAEITMYDILSPIEQHLFETADKSLENIPQELAVGLDELVIAPLDSAIFTALNSITLEKLAEDTARRRGAEAMYFI